MLSMFMFSESAQVWRPATGNLQSCTTYLRGRSSVGQQTSHLSPHVHRLVRGVAGHPSRTNYKINLKVNGSSKPTMTIQQIGAPKAVSCRLWQVSVTPACRIITSRLNSVLQCHWIKIRMYQRESVVDTFFSVQVNSLLQFTRKSQFHHLEQ